jgi:hypothetical protein
MSKMQSPGAEEFIKQVQEVIDKTNELMTICPNIKKYNSTNQLNILAKKLETLPEADLEAAHDTFMDLGGFTELSSSITDVIEKVKIAATVKPCENIKTATMEPSENTKALISQVIQSDCSLGDCGEGPSQVQIDNLKIAVAAADLATAIAQATADTLGIFVITEFASKIAQAVASGLDVVGKTLSLTVSILEREANIVAECEDAAVKRLLLNMCNTINIINSKVDLVLAKLEIIDRKLDELIKLAKEIKAVVDEILLHQIEEALSECKMLIALSLPEYAFGSITKVQGIVEKLIYNSKLAGLTVANAEAYWRQGSYALSKDQYEKALQWFMLSYKQLQTKNVCAVPCPSDPCGENNKLC